MKTILFLYPPYFHDDHLEVFKRNIHLFADYGYTVIIKIIDGSDITYLSKKALEEIEAQHHPFTFLGNKKHYGLIPPSDKIFFVEPHTTEGEMLGMFKIILRQRKNKGV